MTDLSPAAQAVLDATTTVGLGPFVGRAAAAAALRAAVDQVVPEEHHPPRRGMRPGGTGVLSPDEGAEDQRAATRRKLLAIAAELEACCEWFVRDWTDIETANKLRADRRPRPPSLKEQAFGALGRFNANAHTRADEMLQDFDTIRRALEQLDD